MPIIQNNLMMLSEWLTTVHAQHLLARVKWRSCPACWPHEHAYRMERQADSQTQLLCFLDDRDSLVTCAVH